MSDWFGTVSLVVAVTAFLGIIVFEFLKAIRARTISQTGAGRITSATGFIFILLLPNVFPRLDQTAFNTIWWFGAAMIALGVLMETVDRRNSSRAKRNRPGAV